jgi:hypothetical protein
MDDQRLPPMATESMDGRGYTKVPIPYVRMWGLEGTKSTLVFVLRDDYVLIAPAGEAADTLIERFGG